MLTRRRQPVRQRRTREAEEEEDDDELDGAYEGLSGSSSEDESEPSARQIGPARSLDEGGSGTVPRLGRHDFSHVLALKPDHELRPLWIDPADARITLEGFSPLANSVNEFLVAVAEPISRPSLIHEYKLTAYSLYAAVSVGLRTQDILDTLNRFSKTPLPESIVDFVKACTVSYGKVKLVLKHNKYFLESPDVNVLRMLLRDKVIGPLRVESSDKTAEPLAKGAKPTMDGLVIPGTKVPGKQDGRTDAGAASESLDQQKLSDRELFTAVVGPDGEDEDEDEDDTVHSFEIPYDAVEAVKRRCAEINYPVLEEYDFRNDQRNANLEIDLKPSTQIRPYQEKSLSKMFGNGRARSGIIVLPCGAGKTLVGVTAACTIKKSVLVLCTSSVSVMQWRQQFLQWSNVKPESISVFTSEYKEKFKGDAGIVCSTYSMVANTRNRSHDSQKMMDFLTSREWGFIILDEVHVVPAAMFRRVVTTIAAHAKLGLTATLVREDDKIYDLNFLIGPKLYEANWMDLAQKGHIANVQCAEVWCPMTTEFYSEYLRENSRKRMLLYIMNPKKFQACQFLIDYHEKRGDKIIVFSDNVYALIAYALKLKKYYIYGGTSQQERMEILENFQYNDMVNTIFLSKVGDTSIDLPEATCLIQISSHYGSRRQEAQRLGRILRAKRRNDEGFNAFFYSLVSKDTQEMFYSTKRQAFLVDQGYAFKVITHLKGMESLPNLAYANQSERLELLQEVLLQNEDAASIDRGEDDPYGGNKAGGGNHAAKRFKRTTGTLSSRSGADDMAYIEYNKSANKQLRKEVKEQQNHHPLFKKLYAKKRL